MLVPPPFMDGVVGPGMLAAVRGSGPLLLARTGPSTLCTALPSTPQALSSPLRKAVPKGPGPTALLGSSCLCTLPPGCYRPTLANPSSGHPPGCGPPELAWAAAAPSVPRTVAHNGAGVAGKALPAFLKWGGVARGAPIPGWAGVLGLPGPAPPGTQGGDRWGAPPQVQAGGRTLGKGLRARAPLLRAAPCRPPAAEADPVTMERFRATAFQARPWPTSQAAAGLAKRNSTAAGGCPLQPAGGEGQGSSGAPFVLVTLGVEGWAGGLRPQNKASLCPSGWSCVPRD